MGLKYTYLEFDQVGFGLIIKQFPNLCKENDDIITYY